MARKSKQDIAKAKAAKQKKLAIGGAVLLVALLAYQGPKMMKMLNQKPAPPIVSAPTATPGATATPAVDPNSLAAPTLAGTPTVGAPATSSATDLVDAVPVEADAGQLDTFERFATKDPFAAQVSSGGGAAAPSGGSGAGSSSAPKPAAKPVPSTRIPTPTRTPAPTAAPPAPAPTTAVISLNGELLSVGVDTDFPQSGTTFARAGALFHLLSLTRTSAKIAIVGGSYADGANAITLHVGTPLTLQNTADGTKYVLILQKQGTTAPTAATGATPVVPSTGTTG